MKEWLKNNIVSSLTLAAIVGAAIWFGGLESVLFSSPEIKVRTEDHMKIVDPMAIARKAFTDSIDNIVELKHRAYQDSIDKVRDTLTKRNTITIFQMKKLQEQNTKTMEAVLRQIEDLHQDYHN